MGALTPPSGFTTASFWLALISAVSTSVLAAGIWPSDSLYQKLIGVVVSALVLLGYGAGRRNVDEAHQMPAPDQRVTTMTTTVTVPPVATAPPSPAIPPPA